MTDEPVSRIEPCHLDDPGPQVMNVLAELVETAVNLGSRLHPRTAASLADLVRIMNTYYSNLIEGHNTRPREIELALAEQIDTQGERRNLQLEALAHMRLQKAVEERFARGEMIEPASIEFIRWLHFEFYRDAPREMLLLKGEGRELEMKPGEFRNKTEHDVAVGRLVPPSSSCVGSFMAHFESRYSFAGLGRAERMLAMASAHHRFNYIHPFPDGNGRVSRLMSHAIGFAAGIGAHGLWSISRGLARGLEDRGEYKRMLDQADSPRQGDLDGRGNLSRNALRDFTLWFLKVCLDQARFMASLFSLDELNSRLRRYVEVKPGLKPEAVHILEHLALRGEMARGDAGRVAGLPERTARNVLAELVRDGIVASDTPKSPVFLRFPIHAAEILFPQLYPEN